MRKLSNELSGYIIPKNHKTLKAPWIERNVYLNVQLVKENSKSMKLNLLDLNTICRRILALIRRRPEGRVNSPCLAPAPSPARAVGIKQRILANVSQITSLETCKFFTHNFLAANPCFALVATRVLGRQLLSWLNFIRLQSQHGWF